MLSPCMSIDFILCVGQADLLQSGETHQLCQDSEFEFSLVGQNEYLKGFEQKNGIIHNMLTKMKPWR